VREEQDEEEEEEDRGGEGHIHVIYTNRKQSWSISSFPSLFFSCLQYVNPTQINPIYIYIYNSVYTSIDRY
jgi:hypothetical protein